MRNMKQVIFNVGGALSTYLEYKDKKIVVDLGYDNLFNPMRDFLFPLFEKRADRKSKYDKTKYHIDQLVISHPHYDHLNAIKDFNKHFYAKVLTAPNDNRSTKKALRINWATVDDNVSSQTLKTMLERRRGVLKPLWGLTQKLFFLPPHTVESNTKLFNESYLNNISLVLALKVHGTKILLPGDIQKEGMKALIQTNKKFRKYLAKGIDVLIAPHHGLRSSFSELFFDALKEHAVKCLIAISEKPSTEAPDRHVDERYGQHKYCLGKNNLVNGKSHVFCRRTSVGHIFIDYRKRGKPFIELIKSKQTLIERFL
ncbi:ComEC/Rec2 family competence protein [Breznakiellaceae bacterium SP9]